MNDKQKLIDEYSEEYCLFLEAAYGPNMMSEGGTIAIDRMFGSIDLSNKKIMDIGAGLGGVAFYLANNFATNVVGLELGEWMVNEATRRTPDHLKSRVSFIQYQEPLPFESASFDLIYSKGVLTHVRDKLPLFKEVCRALKPNGLLIIDDWLSPFANKWGDRLKKMCEVENLTLYAETEENYIKTLREAGFDDIQLRDENAHYAGYNQAIQDKLREMKTSDSFHSSYAGVTLEQTIECYRLITESIQDNELLIRWIKCRKK